MFQRALWKRNCIGYLELLAPRICGLFASTRSARKLQKKYYFLLDGKFVYLF